MDPFKERAVLLRFAYEFRKTLVDTYFPGEPLYKHADLVAVLALCSMYELEGKQVTPRRLSEALEMPLPALYRKLEELEKRGLIAFTPYEGIKRVGLRSVEIIESTHDLKRLLDWVERRLQRKVLDLEKVAADTSRTAQTASFRSG
jgi:DNA-binding IclR family transcriptional regulator